MPGSQEVEWLLIGTGDIVRKRVASALATARGSKLVGVCGGKERAQAIAKDFGATEVFDSVETALKETRAAAVYVATPVYRHRIESRPALEAGKHVLIEKPLGVNAPDALAMAGAAARSGKIAGCAYYRRCYPRYEHAKKLLADGTLGRVVAVRMAYVAWFNPEANDPKLWRVDPALSGGGPLADMGSHMFDVLIGLLGMPTRVHAFAGTIAHKYAAEDTCSTILTLADGAQVSGLFGWSSQSFTHDMEIIGTKGKLVWSPYDTGKVKVTVGRDTQEFDLPPAANVHLPLVEDFVAAIRDNRPPVCPLAEAAETNRVLDAIYRAAHNAREETP